MADIQSSTAGIRRGNKKRKKKKIEETTGQNIMSATQGGHNKQHVLNSLLPGTTEAEYHLRRRRAIISRHVLRTVPSRGETLSRDYFLDMYDAMSAASRSAFHSSSSSSSSRMLSTSD